MCWENNKYRVSVCGILCATMSVAHPLSSRSTAQRWLEILGDVCLAGIIVVLPGLSAITFELAELYKQALLIGGVGLALAAHSCAQALGRRAEVRMHWTQLLLGLFGLSFLVSSFTSVHPYLSFLGQFSQRGWAFSTMATLLILAWLLIQRMTVLPAATFLSLVILGCLGLTGGGVIALFQRDAFTAVGSVYALAVCAAIGLLVGFGCLLIGLRRFGGVFSLSAWPGLIVRGSVWLLLFLSGGILIAIDFWLAWVMVLVGSGLLFFCLYPSLNIRRSETAWIFLSIGVMALVVLGLIFRLPWQQTFSGEVALSQRASWEIVQQTLAARPWFGSGPGTWVYDQGLYRASVLNTSPFWASRFDEGASVFLTLFATLGMVGAGCLLVLLLSVFGLVFRFLLHVFRKHGQMGHASEQVLVGIIFFSGWVAMAMAMGFYPFHASHQILFWTLTGGVLGLFAQTRFAVDGKRAFGAWFLPLYAVIVTLVVLMIWVKGGQLIWAERQMDETVRAYRAGQTSASQVIERLESTRVIQPWDDVLARSLSQAYLVRVLERVKDKPVSERAQAVGDDVSKMVDAALEATRLAPANAENWANAGLVYAGVAAFTQGADRFAVAMYQEAIERDPQQPEYPYQIGTLFLFNAQQQHVLAEAKDIAVQQQALRQEKEALRQALQWTDRSLALKSDYLPAHYQRAITLYKQGKKEEALHELEVVTVQDPSADHVFELGALYAEHGDRARAMAAFEKVISLDNTQIRARWQLASLYEETGRLSDALTQLRLVAASVPTNTAVQKRLQVLEQQVGQLR